MRRVCFAVALVFVALASAILADDDRGPNNYVATAIVRTEAAGCTGRAATVRI
jgi:hypothetical protein